jgi:hypothetical protein
VTGQVRGLLCNNCNRGIGYLGDDPEIIKAAARYVTKHRQLAELLWGRQVSLPQARWSPPQTGMAPLSEKLFNGQRVQPELEAS